VATPLLDKPEIVAVSHLGEAGAWSTTSRSEESVRTIMAVTWPGS
jgi:hypothetical protein